MSPKLSNDVEIAAVNRLAMNRLEDKLEANTVLLQQSIQNLTDKVTELSTAVRNLEEKRDLTTEKLDGRLRTVEAIAASNLVERVRWLEHKVWAYSGGIAIVSILVGLVLRKFGV